MLETAIGISMVATSTYGIYHSIKETMRARIENVELTDFQLKVGYEYSEKYKVPIVFDMKETPHVLIAGQSGSGKTRMAEYMLTGKDVVLLNAFDNDFLTLKTLERENNLETMKLVLTNLVNGKECFRKPLYLVLDEIMELALSGDKEISNLIMRLLATARHRNLFIVGLTQSAEKEILKYKHLFSNRVCFKQVEDSSYKTVLGYTPDVTHIQKRDFYFASNRKGFGHTYDVGE